MSKLLKAATSTIEAAGPDSFRATISTPTVDRQGDIIDPLGIDYSAYVRGGGFMLWSHRYDDLPVARASKVWADKHGLYGEYRWADHARARQVRDAVADLGVMGISIGFVPLAQEPIGTGFRFTKSEMLEASLTPVPANSQCSAVLRAHGLRLPDDDVVIELLDDEQFEIDPAEVRSMVRDAVGRALYPGQELYEVDPDELRATVRDVVGNAMTALTGRLP